MITRASARRQRQRLTQNGLSQVCLEFDVLEGNNWGMQTSLRTDDTDWQGVCDRIGCYSRIGGPLARATGLGNYGPGGSKINSLEPFDVIAEVDNRGSPTIKYFQDDRELTTFNKRIAGVQRAS
jgi:hypothetical protein